MKVGEAAEFCGVTAETLRNWDRSGKLVARRNPVTGYRYYRQTDLERFLEKVMKERARG
ncbi:MAG: MerR family DNA-binding transcriptional regulator [Pirellulaceae bacterium]